MANKAPFDPDFKKKRFTLTIEVYDNASTFGMACHDGYKPTYHEVVGALEAQKISTIFRQGAINSKEWKAYINREIANHKDGKKSKKKKNGKEKS